MNALEIQKKLPHSYPMLFLDQVVEQTETRAVGYKNVSMNEPFFRGHFPNAPVMPGVLVMESLCQLVWIWSGHPKGVRMTGIKKLRFRRPTMPGDQLKLELDLVERNDHEVVVKATASVDGEASVTGQLTFSLD